MSILLELDNVGKRFNREWIFRNISLKMTSDQRYVILGGNGSGKSTLLQLLSGITSPSEGSIFFQVNSKEIAQHDIFKHVAIASPYLDLYEDFFLEELLDFHFKFKQPIKGVSLKQIPEILYLKEALHKPVKYFSSGMKQRVKLGLAILSDTPILLLDEPTSNLDQKGIDWYSKLIDEYATDRLIVVCSNNQKQEYFFCNESLNIEDYKK